MSSQITCLDSRLEEVRRDVRGRFRVCDLMWLVKGTKSKTSKSMNRDFNRLRTEHHQLFESCEKSKISGCREKQWVCDMKTALEIIWLCKGQRADSFRRACAAQLVQFFNGDQAILVEWKQNDERRTGNTAQIRSTSTTATVSTNATAPLVVASIVPVPIVPQEAFDKLEQLTLYESNMTTVLEFKKTNKQLIVDIKKLEHEKSKLAL